jgi:ABC-2 type transport system ATP-binding protein
MRHLARTAVTARVGTVPDGLARIAGVHDLRVDGQVVTAHLDQGGLGEFLGALSGAGLLELSSHPPTLEQLFLEHYEDGAS